MEWSLVVPISELYPMIQPAIHDISRHNFNIGPNGENKKKIFFETA